MAQAEGLQLPFDGEDAIRTNILEVFDYEGEKQHITYSTSEFSAVCPFSGLPDYAKLIMEYIPDRSCVELKSLKYYLISFRNVGIYQEKATDRIFKDLWNALQPQHLKIMTIYNTRGGIDSTCVIEKDKQGA